MTPLQTLLDERAKEFDEKIWRTMLNEGSVVAVGSRYGVVREKIKAHDQESILQGVRLGLAMGRECVPEPAEPTLCGKCNLVGSLCGRCAANRRLNTYRTKILAALEAKEKELGI